MKNSSNLGDGREIVDGRKFPRAFFLNNFFVISKIWQLPQFAPPPPKENLVEFTLKNKKILNCFKKEKKLRVKSKDMLAIFFYHVQLIMIFLLHNS